MTLLTRIISKMVRPRQPSRATRRRLSVGAATCSASARCAAANAEGVAGSGCKLGGLLAAARQFSWLRSGRTHEGSLQLVPSAEDEAARGFRAAGVLSRQTRSRVESFILHLSTYASHPILPEVGYLPLNLNPTAWLGGRVGFAAKSPHFSHFLRSAMNKVIFPVRCPARRVGPGRLLAPHAKRPLRQLCPPRRRAGSSTA